MSVRAEVVKEPLFRAIGFGLKAGVDVVTPEGRPDIDSVIELAWYPFWLVAVTVKDSPFPVFIPTVLGEIARENPMILSDIETDLISPELFPHTVSVYVPVVGIVKENLLNPVSPKRAVRDRENVQNTVSARRDGETIVTKAKSFISGFAGASGAFRFVDSLVRKFQSKDTTSPA